MITKEVFEKIEKIKLDNVSGAITLAKKALEIYRLYSSTIKDTSIIVKEEVNRIGALLIKAHPTIVAIKNVVSLITAIIAKTESKSGLTQKLDYLYKKLQYAPYQIARQFTSLVSQPATILTLSNSNTVLEVLKYLNSQNMLKQVIVAESRPVCEGKMLAKQLAQQSITTTLIVDAALAVFCKNADIAIIGADAILNDGTVVNKIGSKLLALACGEQNRPVYVVTEVLKYDSNHSSHNPIIIEKKPAREVAEMSEFVNLSVENVYFELVPASIISAIVTEYGVVPPTQVKTQFESFLYELL